MQGLHYHYEKIEYVKVHQNNSQTPKILPHRDRAPWFRNSWIRSCFLLSTADFIVSYKSVFVASID